MKFTGKSILALIVSLFAISALAACNESSAEGPSGPALDDQFLGSPDAPVEVIEYASITCTHCKHFHETVLPGIKANYIATGKVKWIFREFPTAPAQIAMAGFAMMRCSGDDQYFEVADALFEEQNDIFEAARQGKAKEALYSIANRFGMDEEAYTACLRDEDVYNTITKAIKSGEAMNVRMTPTLFVNGEMKEFPTGFTEQGVAKVLDIALGGNAGEDSSTTAPISDDETASE